MPDLSSMAASAGALLKQNQQSIAVSESSCEGLVSASLVAVPGASAYYVVWRGSLHPRIPEGVAGGHGSSHGRHESDL